MIYAHLYPSTDDIRLHMIFSQAIIVTHVGWKLGTDMYTICVTLFMPYKSYKELQYMCI